MEALITHRKSGSDFREGQDRQLDVLVLFTSVPGTLEALRSASRLAHSLRARTRLLVPEVVPYPLPLDRPPVDLASRARHFLAIAGQAGVETTVDIRLCRDRWEAIGQALATRSIVVLGGRRRWWPTPEERLAKHLRVKRHNVIFTELK